MRIQGRMHGPDRKEEKGIFSVGLGAYGHGNLKDQVGVWANRRRAKKDD